MENNFNGTYLELLKKRRKLQINIDLARRREVDSVISEIMLKMINYGISLDEIAKAFFENHYSGKRHARRSAKYMDPESGKTWAGVGRMPLWLKGRSLGDYRLPRGSD